jgi:hypothetical protein
MLSGAGLFVIGYNVLEPLALSLGDFGKLTIPELLDVSHWVVIAAMIVLVPIVLALIVTKTQRTELRRRGPERRRHPRGTPDRRSPFGAPVPG